MSENNENLELKEQNQEPETQAPPVKEPVAAQEQPVGFNVGFNETQELFQAITEFTGKHAQNYIFSLINKSFRPIYPQPENPLSK